MEIFPEYFSIESKTAKVPRKEETDPALSNGFARQVQIFTNLGVSAGKSII
jgi:hypothetical protein